MTQVTNRHLSGNALSTLSLKRLPRRVVVHDGDVQQRQQSEYLQEGVDQGEVRDHTVPEPTHGVLTFLQEEVENVFSRVGTIFLNRVWVTI